MLLNKLYIESYKPKINKFIQPILTFGYIIIGLATLHWIINVIYNKFCIDYTFYGFVMHIFNMSSPFCQFINYIQFEISKNYVQIWFTIGVAIVTFISTKINYSQSSGSLSSSVSE